MSAKRTHRLLLLLFLVSTVGGPLAVSGKKSTGDVEGTCDADAIISAGKRLSEELVAMKNVEGLRSLSEVSRTWKLVRNQQQQVEESFVEVNTRFSTAVRKLTGVKTIKTDDKAKVEALFLSGEPFFVQCAAPVDQLHRTFIDSAAGLVEAGVTPAVIDCNGKLPSGRTVMQRFFAGKTLEEPVFFVVSNRMPPRPFNVKSHVTPEMLVSFATNVTAVKVVRIADAEDFRENCLRRKQCAAVIYDGNYTEGEAEVVKNAARLHRAVAVVEVDTRKLRLSIEESLPPNKGEPRLVFLALDSKEANKQSLKKDAAKKTDSRFEAKAFKAKWDEKEIIDFLTRASTGASKLTKLKTHPQVFDRKEEERAARKEKEKAEKKKKTSDKNKASKPSSPYDHMDEGTAEERKKSSSGKKKSTTAAGSGKRAPPTAQKTRNYETSSKTSPEASSKTSPRPSSSSPSTSSKHKIEVDNKGRQRKSWSVGEREGEREAAQQAAELQERDRERRKREQMMQEAANADGIEFVGEDVSDVDLIDQGPEGGRRGDGHYDPDEDEEEEFQEIVVDDEEEEGSIAEGVEGEGEGSEHTGWPHPSQDASSPHVNHATPQEHGQEEGEEREEGGGRGGKTQESTATTQESRANTNTQETPDPVSLDTQTPPPHSEHKNTNARSQETTRGGVTL